ncbi:MAG TPA: acetyl-CoA carboxylase biotin carboxyl carrier protein subunit [Caulobacteraceae bacterium]|nr:acetyl-CoA carboxylase biotin carboxyl carrier protein subunit [Caulobacteraceae bacterium]
MPSPKAPAPSSASDVVRELAEILNETGLSEIEVERDGQRVRVARNLSPGVLQTFAPPTATSAPVASPAAPAPEPEPARIGETVTSPMVGAVYLQPQPGAPPFVKVGDRVAAGQTLLLVEAMKTMNPIVAPRAGVLVELLVTDAQPVEFGEPLAVIG